MPREACDSQGNVISAEPEGDDYLYDDEPEDEFDPGEECGRWLNGRLDLQCRLAGTEWCDWECPYSR